MDETLPIRKLLNLKEAEKLAYSQGEREEELFKKVMSKLHKYGYYNDIKNLDDFLTRNPLFLDKAGKVMEEIESSDFVMVIADTYGFLSNMYSYFPILYAINDIGKSVFRIDTTFLISSLLDREKMDMVPKWLKQNLVIFNNIFKGDNRLSSMSASIEGLFTDFVENRKIVFTSFSMAPTFKEAKEDILHKTRAIYSPYFEAMMKEAVKPVHIRVNGSGVSLWD
jgi:hypothetical protein